MPEPSQLVLLEQLPTLLSGTKIRFLGCIHAYVAREARIIVKDAYPTATASHPTAVVDIVNILENVNHELIQTGSWVNIIGYVRAIPGTSKRDEKFSRSANRSKIREDPVNVDATMIWSAGAIKLDKYRDATHQYQAIPSGG